MFFKHAAPLMAGLVLCLITVTAGAQTRAVIADDKLAIMKAQYALDNYRWQLQQDREENPGRVKSDENNITEAMKKLQKTQLKLQMDTAAAGNKP